MRIFLWYGRHDEAVLGFWFGIACSGEGNWGGEASYTNFSELKTRPFLSIPHAKTMRGDVEKFSRGIGIPLISLKEGAPRGVCWGDQHPHVDTHDLGGILTQRSQRRGSILSSICCMWIMTCLDNGDKKGYPLCASLAGIITKPTIHPVQMSISKIASRIIVPIAAEILYETSLHTKRAVRVLGGS
mgnify:FL=1